MHHLSALLIFALGIGVGVGGTLLGFLLLMIWAYAVSLGFWRAPGRETLAKVAAVLGLGWLALRAAYFARHGFHGLNVADVVALLWLLFLVLRRLAFGPTPDNSPA